VLPRSGAVSAVAGSATPVSALPPYVPAAVRQGSLAALKLAPGDSDMANLATPTIGTTLMRSMSRAAEIGAVLPTPRC
jgi:hypothetical protein